MWGCANIKNNILKVSLETNFFNLFKGATKLYFTHYSCVVIILFNTGLCSSAFSTISFWKLVFCLFVLSVFFVWVKCFEPRHFCNHHLKRSNYYVILFSLYKNSRRSQRRCSIKKLLKISQYSKESNYVEASF